jgi:hypothetical protein
MNIRGLIDSTGAAAGILQDPKMYTNSIQDLPHDHDIMIMNAILTGSGTRATMPLPFHSFMCSVTSHLGNSIGLPPSPPHNDHKTGDPT